MILEGSIVLESEGMPPKRYDVGEVIFFRKGAHVEGYVNKVAFLRRDNPFPFGIAIRAVNKLRSLVTSKNPILVPALACSNLLA